MRRERQSLLECTKGTMCGRHATPDTKEDPAERYQVQRYVMIPRRQTRTPY